MLRDLFCRITGYRYAYRLELVYKTKGNIALAGVTTTVFTTHPDLMDDHRAMKSAVSHRLLGAIPKHKLCNGIINAEPKFFIGLIKPKGKRYSYKDKF